MKLKGYIEPYSSFSFTIPIYTDGESLFYHTLNDALIINSFVKIDNNNIPLCKTHESIFVKEGDYGIVVFIGKENLPIIDFSNLIVPQLFNSYKIEILNRSSLLKEIGLIREATVSGIVNVENRKKTIHDLMKSQVYTLEEAAQLVKKITATKFDASIDIDVRLGVDPRKANQMIRGVVSLPHGTGKETRVLVLCTPDKVEEAKAAGADFVGLDEYIEKIKNGWTDVDVIITMPSIMAKVGALGRILGPRGLMPNPKSGTVTMEIGTAIKEVKQGKIDFKVDKYGIVHSSIGKVSFSADKIRDNAIEFINMINKLKPVVVKESYIKSIYLSSTMSPGIELGAESLPSHKLISE